MPVSQPLLRKLRADYPYLRFTLDTSERWDGADGVFYCADSHDCHLLHELAHALLSHTSYGLDIDLLKIERAAWDYARVVLAPRYGVTIELEDAEAALDTYRNWLHNRSLCPTCTSSGLQNVDRTYTCVACRTIWQANDAKTCALRRWRLDPQRLRQPDLRAI